MKIINFIFIITCLVTTVRAEESAHVTTERNSLDFQGGNHLASSAQTLPQWKVSFKPYAGASGLSSNFFLNSLSIGVLDFLEVGTIPFILTASNKDLKTESLVWKARLYRSDRSVWSLGASAMKLTPKQQGSVFDSAGINIYEYGLSSEYSLNQDWDLIANLNSSRVVIDRFPIWKTADGEVITMQDYYYGGDAALFLDLRKKASGQRQWVMGVSYSSSAWLEYMANRTNNYVYGVGLSLTWRKLSSWLSSLSLGVHLLERNQSKALFSASF